MTSQLKNHGILCTVDDEWLVENPPKNSAENYSEVSYHFLPFVVVNDAKIHGESIFARMRTTREKTNFLSLL